MATSRIIWASIAAATVWLAIWYPWGHPVWISSYVYNEAIPACMALEGIRAQLACGFPGALSQVYPGFPGLIWMASFLYDPVSYTVTPWLQLFYGGVLLASLPFMYAWLQLFRLDGQVRLLATALWALTSPMLWFAAGTQNTDGLVMALAVISSGAYVLRRYRPWMIWISALVASPVFLGFTRISATAQMYALAIAGITVLQQKNRRTQVFGALLVLAGIALLARTGNNSSIVEYRGLTGANQLQLLGLFLSLPGGILGAYVATTLVPVRWQLPAIVVVAWATILTPAGYVFDVPKSDALYVAAERAWLLGASVLVACLLALRQNRLRLLNLAAIANVLVLVFATWATRAATNPNPRHFMLFALAGCVWTSYAAMQAIRVHRFPWGPAAVVFHLLAVVPALYQPLEQAWHIEQQGAALAANKTASELPCVENLRYSNTLVGSAARVPQPGTHCETYWIVQRERLDSVHESWQPAVATTYYYGYLFQTKHPVGEWIEHQHTTLHQWPIEWTDLFSQRRDLRLDWGIMAVPASD